MAGRGIKDVKTVERCTERGPGTYAGAATFAVLLAASCTASADVVWPALFLETRMFTWWTIGSGLLVEFFVIWWLFRLTPGRAASATFVANAISALMGIPLLPIAGIIWEIYPGSIYMHFLKWGTFNPITWTATFVMACLINTVIEAAVYTKGFKFVVRRREFCWIFVANAASVGLAFGSLFVVPVQS